MSAIVTGWRQVTTGPRGEDAAADAQRTRREFDSLSRYLNTLDSRVTATHASSNRLQFTGTRTTTSSSFAAIATDTIQLVDFVKHHDDAGLIGTIGMALYSTGAVASVELAMQINGTDYVVVRRQLNAAASVVETAYGDSDVITDVPAGTYTITLRWRRVSGTGTVTTDATQQGSLKVLETF